MDASSGGALDLSVVDTLFRNCRFSLRIPDGNMSPAGDYAVASGSEWSVNDVMGNMPARRFLYYGERTPAFVAAVIPNVEHLRWALAASMGRTEAPELSQGEFALRADECEQFFSMLDNCITAYEATTALADSSSATPRPAQPASVSGIPSFKVNASLNAAGSIEQQRVSKLADGAWCCVYPFVIDTPVPSRVTGHSNSSALSFEIRTACKGVDDLLKLSYTNQLIDRNALNSRAAHLEELATKVASRVLAHGGDTTAQPRLLSTPEYSHSEQPCHRLNLALEMPRRIFQALVATRPIVLVSAQTTELPASFGTNAMLISVNVQCDAMAARNLVLRSIQIQCSEWHVEPLQGQPILPFVLAGGSCWQSIFKVSRLTRLDKHKALDVLCLLNKGFAGEPTGKELSTESYDLAAHVVVGTNNSSHGAAEQTFRVTRHIAHCSQSQSLNEASVPAKLDAVAPGTRQQLAAAFKGQITNTCASLTPLAPAMTNDGRLNQMARSVSENQNSISRLPVPAVTSPVSLAFPQTSSRLSETSAARPGRYKARAASMLKIPVRSHRSSSIFGSDRPLTSPIRAGQLPPTIFENECISDMANALSTVSPSRSQHRTSVSVAKLDPFTSSFPTSQPVMREQGQQQPSLGMDEEDGASLLGSGSRATLGTIDVLFEAPPKVCLGDKISVRVHITNNSSISCLRLRLLDGGSDLEQAESEDTAAPKNGLLPLDCTTVVPPLRPKESTLVSLRYVAAAPHFHSAGPVRLIDRDSDGEQTLATLDSPFAVYVEDVSGTIDIV